MHISNRPVTAIAAAMAAAALLATASASAADLSGYVVAPNGQVYRDAAGNCWRSTQWTRGNALKECDPGLFAGDGEFKALEQPRTRLEQLTVQGRAVFAFNDDTLTEEGRAALDDTAERIAGWNVERVRVIGYADRIGGGEYNRELSERRAQTVVAYLRTKPALADVAIDTEVMGQKQPMSTCDDVTGRALIECLAPNRRVVVEVAVSREVPDTNQ
ncbi:MAG: OmpA family protein [Ectothiorhodospiraceae bacterium]|jgi:OOP family OmpA-OmpF porin